MGITIKEIAEIAGVSRGTVDRALHNRGRINPDVAEKIKTIAEKYGYKSKKRRKSNTVKIGIITHLSNSSFMISIKKGIYQAKKELFRRNIEVVVKEIDGVDEIAEYNAIKELIDNECISALGIMPIDTESIRELLNKIYMYNNIPIITFNCDMVGIKRNIFVGMDNKKSGRVAAGLFNTIMNGKGKILIITGRFTSLLNNNRVDGFVEEIKELSDELEIVSIQVSYDDEDEVKKIIVKAINEFSDIKGIFLVSAGHEGISRALDELKLEKRPYIIVYDQTPKTEMLILDNKVDFLIDQNGFEQGYKALNILAQLLIDKNIIEDDFVDTGIHIKNKYNL